MVELRRFIWDVPKVAIFTGLRFCINESMYLTTCTDAKSFTRSDHLTCFSLILVGIHDSFIAENGLITAFLTGS